MSIGNLMFRTRAINRLKRDFTKSIDFFKFYFLRGYKPSTNSLTNSLCGSFYNISNEKIQQNNPEIIELKRLYFSHRFNLLGSGWVRNSFQSQSLGCIGFQYDGPMADDISKPSQVVALPHRKTALKIEKFISVGYDFIDWQRDIKSGYRWNVRRPYFSALGVIGRLEGVDIKSPWELSRLQHLPQLAFFVRNSSLAEQEKAKLEFCNVSLDFIASNPTGMGVNWACPMDVAIRASNLIVAKSLFSQLGENNGCSHNFEAILTDSIFQHGKFIYNHLECNSIYPERNNNHYLSNISGLIFCGAYFEQDPEASEWFKFAQTELLVCLDNQFHSDGSNFEASTSYHRLSGELIIYPIAVLLKLYGKKWVCCYLGKDRLEKLYKIGQFTKSITKPDGTIPQIGDNDSGRYFKIDLSGEHITNQQAADKYLNLEGYLEYYDASETYWDQNCLDHSSFVNLVEVLFGSSEVKSFEAELVMLISGNLKLARPIASSGSTPSPVDTEIHFANIDNSDGVLNEVLTYKSELSLSNISTTYYPDFGLTILKCDNHFYCSIYSGGVGQSGNGGHAHTDFGAYDLVINSKDIAKGPGTFLYTPSEKWRKIFREKLHNGICKYLYIFPSAFSCSLSTVNAHIFMEYNAVSIQCDDVYRVFSFTADEFNIRNVNGNIPSSEDESYYSPGYGKLTRQ
jgi:hypothetical protein